MDGKKRSQLAIQAIYDCFAFFGETRNRVAGPQDQLGGAPPAGADVAGRRLVTRQPLGGAEIAELQLLALQQKVLRFQVAMADLPGIGFEENTWVWERKNREKRGKTDLPG